MGQLEAEVGELKRQLAGNSRNSSRPPSSDRLAKPPVVKSLRRPSGRRPGGQDGHAGSHLARIAVPDEVVVHVAERCERCHEPLVGAPLGRIARQVFDLPEIRLRVTEHIYVRRQCGCGHVTSGVFEPSASVPSVFGVVGDIQR